MCSSIIRLSNYPNAYDLIFNYNHSICCKLDDNSLSSWINKVIDIGDPLAIIKNGKIIAFLLLYCNQLDTLEAYICNVYVKEEYRGKKLSVRLVNEAISICKSRQFRTINLDVAKDNISAIKVYTQCGFTETDSYIKDSKEYIKMSYIL